MSNEENLDTPHVSAVAAIRRESEDGSAYWSDGDLAKVLDYNDYRNFLKVIAKARIACENSGQAEADHFVDVNDMVRIGSGATRKIEEAVTAEREKTDRAEFPTIIV